MSHSNESILTKSPIILAWWVLINACVVCTYTSAPIEVWSITSWRRRTNRRTWGVIVKLVPQTISSLEHTQVQSQIAEQKEDDNDTKIDHEYNTSASSATGWPAGGAGTSDSRSKGYLQQVLAQGVIIGQPYKHWLACRGLIFVALSHQLYWCHTNIFNDKFKNDN